MQLRMHAGSGIARLQTSSSGTCRRIESSPSWTVTSEGGGLHEGTFIGKADVFLF